METYTKDLFEEYKSLPSYIQSILSDYELEDFDYEKCKQLQQELECVGYTFDYSLDAEPFNLRLI
jgi:hypothetical protein